MYVNVNKSLLMPYKLAGFILAICSFISLSLSAKENNPATVGQGLKKPVTFVENKGQVTDRNQKTRNDIKYKLSTPGCNLFVGKNKLCYQFRKTQGTKASDLKITTYQMDVSLLGANESTTVVTDNKQTYHENYYGRVSKDGVVAEAYNTIIFKNVYPKIDWKLYVKNEKVEYDFIVHPGGKVSDIKLAYQGATKLTVKADGSIFAKTPLGTVEEKSPVAYQAETNNEVAAKFHLKNNILSFETGNYDGTLVIDPFIMWGTYFGGVAEDVATSVTSGAGGVLYVGGYTASSGLAVGGVTFAAFAGGSYDAFLASYTAAGVLSWCTYFGDIGTDEGTGVAVDGAGNVYLSGFTSGTGTVLATVGAYQTANAGGNDAFLGQFNNATGSRIWSTYFGGTLDDYGYALTTDNTGAIYIGGQTASTAGIASIGAFMNSLNGAIDGFLAKFNNAGGLSWSTYFGGPGQEAVQSIACDAATNVYFTGQTNSNVIISSIGSYQTVLNGVNDAYIEKFSPLGFRIWGTYFGGPGTEQGNGIVCDASNNVVAVVNTNSTTNIASNNGFQSSYGGGTQDGSIVMFNTSGNLVWSTYYGGGLYDLIQGICVDPFGNFAVTGMTYSTTGIASTDGYQILLGGDFDAFFAKFDPFGRRLWGSYFGGAFYDWGYGITCDVNNQLTMVGYSSSTAGISTPGSQLATYQGGTDAFVAKFDKDTTVLITQRYTDTFLCAGSTFNLNYTANYNFLTTNTFTAQLSDISGSFATPVAIGTVTANTSGIIACTIPAATPTGTGYRIRVVASAPAFTSPDEYYNITIANSLPRDTIRGTTPVCIGANVQLSVTAGYTVSGYNWTGPNTFTSIIYNPAIAGVTSADSGWYYVTLSHNGCPSVKDSILISVNTFIPKTPKDSAASPICANYTLHLYGNPDSSAGVYTYHWSGPGGFVSTLQNPTIASISTVNAGTYYLVDTLGGCPSLKDSVIVSILPNSPVSIVVNIPSDTVCKNLPANFTVSTTNGGLDPQYQWMSGTPDTPIVGAIFNNYSSSYLHSGEKIFCVLTSSAACAFPIHDTSNKITMTILDNTPIAYITAYPDSVISPGDSVVYSAYITNPGSTTVYDWQVNGVTQPGANSSTFTLRNITAPVWVNAVVFSNAICANPTNTKTNVIGTHFISGVNNVSEFFKTVALFPNPNSGEFMVCGKLDLNSSEKVTLEIYNLLGQVVYSKNLSIANGELSEKVDVSNIPVGVYQLKLTIEGEQRIFKLSVEK